MKIDRKIAILCLLVTIGCTPQPIQTVPVETPDPARDLFIQSIEGPPTQRSEALADLRKNFPENPWTARARQMNELLRTKEAQGAKVKLLEKEKEQCRQDLEVLQKESAKLREDLEKLRNLLIDMELRSTK